MQLLFIWVIILMTVLEYFYLTLCIGYDLLGCVGLYIMLKKSKQKNDSDWKSEEWLKQKEVKPDVTKPKPKITFSANWRARLRNARLCRENRMKKQFKAIPEDTPVAENNLAPR